jgi:nitrogen fixation protein FixH
MASRPAARRFTGAHLAATVVAFFAVVIAVNLTMATLASRSFSGAIVKNGYVASQDFDRWLAAGRAQAALGWSVAAKVEDGALVVEVRGRDSEPLTDLAVAATLRHPIDRTRSVDVTLHARADGIYAAPIGVRRGQWQALIRLNAGQRQYRHQQRLFVEG